MSDAKWTTDPETKLVTHPHLEGCSISRSYEKGKGYRWEWWQQWGYAPNVPLAKAILEQLCESSPITTRWEEIRNNQFKLQSPHAPDAIVEKLAEDRWAWMVGKQHGMSTHQTKARLIASVAQYQRSEDKHDG